MAAVAFVVIVFGQVIRKATTALLLWTRTAVESVARASPTKCEKVSLSVHEEPGRVQYWRVFVTEAR